MRNMIGRLAGAFLALALGTTLAAAQSKVTIAVGGGGCLCYLPTILAKQLGEYEKAGVAVELVDLKGGSDALKGMMGGSADVVSGYFDHCVNLAAKKQELQSFVVYDRFPALVLVVSPKYTGEIKSIKDLAGRKVGVTAPGSSTDFFLKFLLKKNGLDPTSASVIGVGLNATAVAAMEQGQGGGPGQGRGDGRPRRHRASGQPQGLADSRRHPHPEGHARDVRRRISGRFALFEARLDQGS